MAPVPVPNAIAAKIADRAVQIARQDLQRRQWKSADQLNPISQDGKVGISTTAKHLMYQNRGTKPRVMHELEGKVIPMKTGFRTARGVGQPGWVNIPNRGRVWREQKWRHPGIKPQRFMENAINQAMREFRPQISNMMLQVLMGKPPE